MRKLLLAAGTEQPKPATYDFACYLARLTDSRLTGVFMEPLAHDEVLVTSMTHNKLHLKSVCYTGIEGNEAIREACDEHIARFKDACTAREVIGVAHRDRDVPWEELLAECRYADAVILEEGFSVTADESEKSKPSAQASKLMREAECPVILAPSGFEQIDEIVFAFDGSKSSVYGIREFMHLFPQFRDKKVVVLEIREDAGDSIHEKYRLKEWLNNYYTNIEFVLLEGESESRLLEYCMSRTNPFIVMGGYGRSKISTLIKPSASATIVKILSAPIFIAHY